VGDFSGLDSAAWDDLLRRLSAQMSVGWCCCCVEWRKSACGAGMPKISEVHEMKAWLLSSWEDVNENNDVEQQLGFGDVGIGEVRGVEINWLRPMERRRN
jgi:hypothetical protein